MAWGRDTQAKRDALELDVRRKLMATEKKGKDSGKGSGKGSGSKDKGSAKSKGGGGKNK